MPSGACLSKQTAQAIYDYTNDLLTGDENQNFIRRHKDWINSKSFVRFIHDFCVLMTRLGVDIDVLNDELCAWITSAILEDFNPDWYERRNSFYIAHQYYTFTANNPASPFYATDKLSIIGDLFNNFPLTNEGKLYADEIHQLLIEEFQGLLRGTCVQMALNEENL